MLNNRTSALDADLTDLATWRYGPPHAVFDELRTHDPIHWQVASAGTHTGGFWSLTRFDDITAVSKDRDHFTVTRGAAYPVSDLEVFANLMMQMDPPQHTRLRRMVSAGFTPRVVARFDGWVRQIVAETLDTVETLDTFDFIDQVSTVIPALVIADILGVPREKRSDIVDWANALFAAVTDAHDAESNARAAAAIWDYALELREMKRREPAEDIVTELVNAPEQLSDDQFQGFFLLLIMAGFETTNTMMAQGMRAILEEEYIAEQVAAECGRGRSSAAVEEILRYVSPLNNMARCAKEDMVFSGRRIAKDDMLVMWYPAANRDPSVFKDPHRFDTSRDPNPHMGFGAGGPHFCMGAHLARLEGRILLEELYRRDVRLELAGDPDQVAHVIVNQLARLPVVRV